MGCRVERRYEATGFGLEGARRGRDEHRRVGGADFNVRSPPFTCPSSRLGVLGGEAVFFLGLVQTLGV